MKTETHRLVMCGCGSTFTTKRTTRFRRCVPCRLKLQAAKLQERAEELLARIPDATEVRDRRSRALQFDIDDEKSLARCLRSHGIDASEYDHLYES